MRGLPGVAGVGALFGVAVLFSGCGESMGGSPGAGKIVQPSRATWSTGNFNEAVVRELLEDLGYNVRDPVELTNDRFYSQVADGDVDFWANGWFPLHDKYRESFEKGAHVAGTISVGGALQGYLVDQGSINRFGIRTLEDFKRPEVLQAFDANGDGKADLYGCETLWACHDINEYHIRSLGLGEHINNLSQNYDDSMGEVLGRFKNGKSVLFYAWTPSWTVATLVPGEAVQWI